MAAAFPLSRRRLRRVHIEFRTAAGDTFTGYYIAGIIRGLSVEESMDLMSKAAAIAVSRPGAGVSIPTMEETAVYK